MTEAPQADAAHPGRFANPEVPPASIPGAAPLPWQPVHPRYAHRLQAAALIRVAAMATVAAAAHLVVQLVDSETLGTIALWPLRILWALVAIFTVKALAWPLVSVPRQGYVVREKDILYRSGVFWRTVRVVPFNRVQHTRTDSSPLDRRFGLANLTVFPAGSGGHEIPGLGADTAENLRAWVSDRIEAEKFGPSDEHC